MAAPLRDRSLFWQLVIPMLVIGLVGVSLVVYSSSRLKGSVAAIGGLYEEGGGPVATLEALTSDVAHFRALALKHLASENAAEMYEIGEALTRTRGEVEYGLREVAREHGDDRGTVATAIATLREGVNGYFRAIDAALIMSADFEKELAFERLNNAEQRYVGLVNDSLRLLLRHEFDRLRSDHDLLLSAAFTNLYAMIALVIGGGAALLFTAFAVTRRASRRLARLLVWSQRFSEEGRAEVLADDTGDEVGRLTGAMDVMARRITRAHDALEVAREEAEAANLAKSEFLANMSHELRTPMHAILSFSEMGERKINDAELSRLETYFSNIRVSGERLLGLLNDLLDLAKLEAGRMELDPVPGDLGVVVDAAVTEFQVLARDKGLTLEVVPPTVSLVACFDAEKMLQVVRNLISNAVKFTPEGRRVSVVFEDGMLPGDNGPRHALRLKVIDQGVGVPEGERETIFDKFVQSSKTRTKAGGTGLGLAICREIVHEHGGEIRAANHPEGGAVFSVTLPRA